MTWWPRTGRADDRDGDRGDDLDDDVEAHLELAEHELRQQGMAPEEARRMARLQFGNLRRVREDVRAEAGWPGLEALLLDARAALRRLRADRGTSLLAATLLAVAVGLASTMFTVADALLLRPAPFRAPETLMRVYAGPEGSAAHPNLTLEAIRAARETPGIEALHVAARHPVTFDDGDLEGDVMGALVTAGVFDDLGVTPLHGRTFTADDVGAVTGAIVISETLWRQRYGADPAIVGKAIRISGGSGVVVGVVPAWFSFPTSSTRMWRPLDLDRPSGVLSRTRGTAYAYARLTGEVPASDMELAMARLVDASGEGDASTRRVSLRPVGTPSIDPYSAGIVRASSAAVALVFLVLCANAAAVLLTRLQRRRRVFALCATLGAPRHRLLRQALLEQAVIGGAGVLGGVAIAWYLVEAARAWLPHSLLYTSLNTLDVDFRTIVVAATLGSLAMAACGVAPAWFGRRHYAAPQAGWLAHGAGSERTAARAPVAMLIGQTALAILLCVGAWVQWQSLGNLLAIAPGIDVDRLVTFDVEVPAGAASGSSAEAVMTLLRDRLRALPGIEDATVSSGVLPDAGTLYLAEVSSDRPGTAPLSIDLNSYDVQPNFDRTYGIPLLAGRWLTNADGRDTVVVSRSFVRRLWPAGDALGRTFRFDGRAFTIVGIARDVLNPLLDPRTDEPEMYEVLTPAAVAGETSAVDRTLTVRCRTVCPDVGRLRDQITLIAPAARVSAGTHMRARFARGLERPRAAALVATSFAFVGTLAAAAGLFAVLARATASRQREFGIRLALGATPRSLAWMIRLSTLRIVALSLLLSAGLAWPLGRILDRIQHGSSVGDPWAWAAAASAVGLAAVAATIRPSRQASRVEPVLLLREQ